MKLNKRLRHDYDYCLNCKSSLEENDSFCNKCGQKRTTGRISFGQLVIQFIEDTFSWDARLFRSIRTLFTPGKLTIEYFKGHHVPYWQPLRLFLFLAALQMIVVNASFNSLNETVQKANESVKRDVYEYLLLRKLDSLKLDASKSFSNKKLATSAMDSLLIAYIYPERFKKNRLSSDLLRQKQDSVRIAIIKEMKAEAEAIDTSEVNEAVKDFSEDFIKGLEKGNTSFSTNMESDSIKIPFAKIKKAILPSINYDSTGNFKNAGWNVNVERNPKQKDSIEFNPINNNSDKSINGNLSISKIDFIKLSADEIINKYRVEGFVNQVIAKQTIKAMKDGKSGIEFFISRLSWMIILMMPIFALFLELVNRPYYYVEHVIFSFHCHAFMFFIVSIVFFVNHNIIPSTWKQFNEITTLLLTCYLLYYFYKAMRNVYQQGRLKTLAKYSFLLFSYFITMAFALVFTLIVSFFFF